MQNDMKDDDQYFQTEMWTEDSGINSDEKPFNPSEIDIVSLPFSVYHVVERLRSGEIDLYPEFQRRPDLWRPWQQSQLIESLILGIPLPVFYFTAEKVVVDEWGVPRQRLHVVDGLQRLCSIRNFIIGCNDDPNRKMALTQLQYLRKLEGVTFDQLAPALKRNILEAPLTAFMIRASTPPKVKFNIFKRLNTGGLPLSQQEIRHAMHQDGAAQFLADLADSDAFTSATGGRVSQRRMLDREYVNRFLAFRIFGVGKYHDMDTFLDDALTDIEKDRLSERTGLKHDFITALNTLKSTLGEVAFSQYDCGSKTWNRQINKALFEVQTVLVSKLSARARERFAANAEAILEFSKLFEDQSENGLASVVSTSTGRGSRVRRRYEIMADYYHRVAGERPEI